MKDILNEKGKKIRRILLLKIDQELKSGINKNIMINSQNICELNKSYNSYKILLSVNTEVYSNYVEFFETNSFPNRKKQIKLPKHDSPKKKLKLEQTAQSLNSSFDSNSPVPDFIPNKIDLGHKKFTKRTAIILIKETPKFFEEADNQQNKTKDDEKTKSTKVNKGINKVINKNNIKKINSEDEDDDNRTKFMKKLRKYCYKLIKRKKRIKKPFKIKRHFSLPGDQDPKEFVKNIIPNKQKFSKRKTIISTNPLIMPLFDQRESPKKIFKRKGTDKKAIKYLNPHLIEKGYETEKNKFLQKPIKNHKINSFKNVKSTTKEKEKEKTISDKKRKLRRVQTMNMKISELIKFNESKKKEKKKKEHACYKYNNNTDDHLFSTKISRPTKLVIINTNNIIIKKKNSLIEDKNSRSKPKKNIVKFNGDDEKNRYRVRKSFAKNSKASLKIFKNLEKLKSLPD